MLPPGGLLWGGGTTAFAATCRGQHRAPTPKALLKDPSCSGLCGWRTLTRSRLNGRRTTRLQQRAAVRCAAEAGRWLLHLAAAPADCGSPAAKGGSTSVESALFDNQCQSTLLMQRGPAEHTPASSSRSRQRSSQLRAPVCCSCCCCCAGGVKERSRATLRPPAWR